MSELTFEEQFLQIWQPFVDFSQDKDNSDPAVIAMEAETDKKIDDLIQAFSHPPGRPNRRRP